MKGNATYVGMVAREYSTALATKNVLIVDDEVDHRMVLADLLESYGYSTITAEGAKQALAKLSTRTVDLVITDFKMPEMNGLELIRAMANQGLLNQKPVILVTANTIENLEELAKSAGAFATLVKPYDHKTLLALIVSAINESDPNS